MNQKIQDILDQVHPEYLKEFKDYLFGKNVSDQALVLWVIALEEKYETKLNVRIV